MIYSDLMVIGGIAGYLIIGFFVVKWIHVSIEACPDAFTAFLGVIVWPITFTVGIFSIGHGKGKSLVERLFGEGK